jgi:hypothetical protein
MTTLDLTRSQRILLEKIQQFDGEWTWYQLGRACLHRLDSPADFDLRPLRQAGLIEERRGEAENLSLLFITDLGRRALSVFD